MGTREARPSMALLAFTHRTIQVKRDIDPTGDTPRLGFKVERIKLADTILKNRNEKGLSQVQLSRMVKIEFYKPAEERLNQLVKELPKLQAEVDFLKVNNISADAVAIEAKALYARWPSLPVDEKRRIAESLCEKIVVGRDQIDIRLTCLPTSEESCKTQQRLREMWLGEQGGDGAGPGHFPVGEAGFATFVGKVEALVIDSQKLQQGGMEVVDADHILNSLVTEVVGGAVDIPRFETAAGGPE